MYMRVRRAFRPAALAAAFLVLLGWHAVPAQASIDPELVVESVVEDGYYVDSGATYLQSDAELDRLRAELDKAGRVGVVVLPAGTPAGPIMNQLLQSPNRRTTYLVMSGSKLSAASNGLPKATVNQMAANAATAGSPMAEVLKFLALLNPAQHHAAKPTQKASALPDVAASDEPPSDSESAAPVAAPKRSGGDNTMLYAAGGLALIVLLGGGGGFIVWRRKQAASMPGPSTPGSSTPGQW
jgi:LPXTG-motif cell wall-anchored protein